MQTIASTDGVRIGFRRSGSGPNLVLVHGTAANHTRWNAILPRFEEHFTVTAIDRRGRGGSGDGDNYALEREFEDVAAIVESLDAPVLLFGHSYGGICSLEAAAMTRKLAGLILYEPPIVAEGEAFHSREQLQRLEALLEAGDRERVVATFLAEIAAVNPAALKMLRSSPAWPDRVAAAHTLPRELRAQDAYRLDAKRFADMNTPVLLLQGGDSPPVFVGAIARLQNVLPNARTVVMPGQQHVAMDAGPALVVDSVLGFWREAI